MRTISSIEALESRIAPAGVFVDATTLSTSLIGGVLKVGPKLANAAVEISVEQLSNGDFLVSDLAGDNDLETTADLTGSVASISITTGTGDDTIHVVLGGDTALRGGVTIATGTGDDIVGFNGGTLRGALSITAKGTADITVDSSMEATSIKGAVKIAQVGGSFVVGAGSEAGSVTAAGATDFGFHGSARGPLTFSNGLAAASYAVGGAVGGNLTISGGVGGDLVDLADVFVRGFLAVNLGAGNNALTVGAGASVHGIAKITALAGDDSVTIGSALGSGPVFASNLSVALGEAVSGNAFSVLGGIYSAGLSYKGGTGADTVSIGATPVIWGALKITGGNGANNVTVGGFGQLVSFSYAGGTGVDTVTLTGAGSGFLTGAATLGAGADSLTILGTSPDFFLAFTVDGGLDADVVAVDPALTSAGLKLVNI